MEQGQNTKHACLLAIRAEVITQQKPGPNCAMVAKQQQQQRPLNQQLVMQKTLAQAYDSPCQLSKNQQEQQ